MGPAEEYIVISQSKTIVSDVQCHLITFPASSAPSFWVKGGNDDSIVSQYISALGEEMLTSTSTSDSSIDD